MLSVLIQGTRCSCGMQPAGNASAQASQRSTCFLRLPVLAILAPSDSRPLALGSRAAARCSRGFRLGALPVCPLSLPCMLGTCSISLLSASTTSTLPGRATEAPPAQ